MHIDLQDISDLDLRAFMMLLHREELGNIVVVGGAVRDMLAGRPYRDIDIAVRLPVSAPHSLRTPHADQKYEILPMMEAILTPLVGLLGCSVDAFCREENLPFRNTAVCVLGLVPVEDSIGSRYPDIFVDNRGQVFGAHCELTVNRIAISGNGEVWPELYIAHLRDRIGTFTQGPLGIRLYGILRALRTCKRLGLKLEPAAVKMIEDHLSCLQNPDRFYKEASPQGALPIMRELFDDETITLVYGSSDLLLERIEAALQTCL